MTCNNTSPRGRARNVAIGSKVRVLDADGEEEYTIVTSAEADPWHGNISSESPVERALLQAQDGDEVLVRTPSGIRALTIVEVTDPA